MSKEMNNIKVKVTKYDMICGLFMSLIIGLSINHEAALTFFLGVCIGSINYIISYYSVLKWLSKKSGMIIWISILRITLIVLLAIPFISSIEMISLYIGGFTIHLIILGCCTISRKGSA